MTNILKCDKCNIVIDEMLSYMQNKVSVIDEETLVRICVSSFSSDEIKNSKALLFDSVPSNLRKITRKNKGKEVRDLTDIINLLKTADPDDIPVFVARQLEKLPPITFDHLDCTKLLKDLVRMQATIDEVKCTYATLDQLKELKTEFLQIKNDSILPTSSFKVNAKRVAWLLDSGPMGLSHLHNSSHNELCNNSASDLNKKSPQYREIMRAEEKQNKRESCTQQRLLSAGSASAGTAALTHAQASHACTTGAVTFVGAAAVTFVGAAAVTLSPTEHSRQTVQGACELIATNDAVAFCPVIRNAEVIELGYNNKNKE